MTVAESVGGHAFHAGYRGTYPFIILADGAGFTGRIWTDKLHLASGAPVEVVGTASGFESGLHRKESIQMYRRCQVFFGLVQRGPVSIGVRWGRGRWKGPIRFFRRRVVCAIGGCAVADGGGPAV